MEDFVIILLSVEKLGFREVKKFAQTHVIEYDSAKKENEKI